MAKWNNENMHDIFIYFEGITECVERSDCRFYLDFYKNDVHSRILKYRWQTLLLPKYLGCATSPSIGIYMYWLEWLCSSFNWIKWLTSRTWVILLLALKHTHTHTPSCIIFVEDYEWKKNHHTDTYTGFQYIFFSLLSQFLLVGCFFSSSSSLYRDCVQCASSAQPNHLYTAFSLLVVWNGCLSFGFKTRKM